jgi:hypothetical protein
MTPSDEIAATEVELKVAEALAVEIRSRDLRSFAEYHSVCDANVALANAMAAEGLDVLADGGDFATAERITATVDVLLDPDIDRNDGNGEPMTCEDCSRPMAWDERRGDYRHLVGPTRGCSLILAEDPPDLATRARRERVTRRPVQLAEPPAGPRGPEPPGPVDIGR